MLTLLALTIAILLIALGGLAFNINLHKHGGLHGTRRDYRKSSTSQLHQIIFMQH